MTDRIIDVVYFVLCLAIMRMLTTKFRVSFLYFYSIILYNNLKRITLECIKRNNRLI